MPNYQSTYIEKDTDIENVIEIFGKLLHQLNGIMNNLDSQNVKRINTNATVIKSDDGSTEIDGSQLVMYDGSGVKRVTLGYNKKTGKFAFTINKPNGNAALTLTEQGNATFSGNIAAGSTITGSTISGGTINVDTDITVGNDIIVGNQTGSGDKHIKFYTSGNGRSGAQIAASYDGTVDTLLLSAWEITLSAPDGVRDWNGKSYVSKGYSGNVWIDGVQHTFSFENPNG